MRNREPFKVSVINRPDYPKEIKEDKPKITHVNKAIDNTENNKSLFTDFENYSEKIKNYYILLQGFGRTDKYINLCIDSCMVDFKTEIYEILRTNIKLPFDQERIFHSQEIQDCVASMKSFLDHMFKETPNDKNEAYSLINAKTLCKKIRIAFNINGIPESKSKCIIDYVLAFISVVYPHSNSNL